MLEVTYGYKATAVDDKFVVNAEILVQRYAQAASPSKFIVNAIPTRASVRRNLRVNCLLMKDRCSVALLPEWAPGSAFKQVAATWRKHAADFTEDLYQHVVSSVVRLGLVCPFPSSNPFCYRRKVLPSLRLCPKH